MSAPVAVHIKQVQHWKTPPLCEYRTIDADGEPVLDGAVIELPDYLTETGQQTVDHATADAIANGYLPAP